MSQIRVAVVGINYAPEPTGIAPYTSGMAKGLQDRGHDVRVVTTFPHYPHWRATRGHDRFWRDERVNGVPVTRVRHYVPAKPQNLRRLASELSFGLGALIASWGQPDVVLLPSPALFSSAAALLRVRGNCRPGVAVIVQDLYSAGVAEARNTESMATRTIGRLESTVLRRADEVAVIHDRFKKRLVTRLGVDEDRIHVIRNWTHVQPVPAFDRSTYRASLGWRGDEFVVVHTGAMGEKQALQNVVDAARLADASGAIVRFVLVGDGGQRLRLQEVGSDVQRLDFAASVSGDDYPKLLASADALLVNERPGHLETAVPSKLTSYFSSGRPVIAATEASSTTADEVADSQAGVRVDPGRPEALLAAVLDLARRPSAAETLGANGPQYCSRVCSQDVSLDGYDAMVRRLAAIGSKRRSA